jgi:acetyl-CoA acetyltransferase
MAEFGTTQEQLAGIAVSTRQHAALNPAAQMRDLITIEDVLASRMIADPLHLLDCSLVSDGGSAIVMCSAERAADLPHDPIYLMGAGEGHSHEHISAARSLTTSAAKEAGQRAYAMAGLQPSDMDFAQLYDCFTPTVLVELEDLGFCAKVRAVLLLTVARWVPVERCQLILMGVCCLTAILVTPVQCSH